MWASKHDRFSYLFLRHFLRLSHRTLSGGEHNSNEHTCYHLRCYWYNRLLIADTNVRWLYEKKWCTCTYIHGDRYKAKKKKKKWRQTAAAGYFITQYGNIDSKQKHVHGACGAWAHADNSEQQMLVGMHCWLLCCCCLLSELHWQRCCVVWCTIT